VLFGRYGGKEEEVINGEPIEFKVTLDYVHIPVLAHISGAQRNIARAFAVVGPSFGFRTGATRTVVDLSTDASDQFKKNEVAFVLGGGVELLSAIIQLRYTIGMTDILTDFGHGLYAITSAKNQSVQLMGGVSLFGYRKPRQ
jgi:hypothetical protein